VEEVLPTLSTYTITLVPSSQALLVDGDALRLEQVLQNIIQNAIKYSPNGGPITIATFAQGESACVAVADQGIGIPQAALQRQQELLSRRIAEMYKMGEYGWLEVLLNAGGFSDAETQVTFFRLIREQDHLEQQRLEQLAAEVDAIEATIADRREEALEIKAEIDADRAQIEQKLAARQEILDGLDGKIKAILARQARLEAAEAARLARLAGVDLRSIHGTPAQIAAVRFCMRYLGVPYVWGGADPGGFDCSGLVMYVFARFGVVLPHYAASQATMGVPVPPDQLQTGDLVFFGSPVPGGIHHVGMYVGNGLFIEAPHTGDVVKVSLLAGRGMTAARRYPLSLP
jgi:cell wall-associated NlpC family hydrolase